MDLITLYKSVLEAAGAVADKDGFVSVNQKKINGSPNFPLQVDGKRLVLPTQKQLQNPTWTDRIAFHPLYENAMRNESAVVAKLRQMFNRSL